MVAQLGGARRALPALEKEAELRTLGIDFGERRIGLAISDPDRRWALPLDAVERRSDRQAAHRIAEIARREEVGELVVGEPRHADGEPSPLAVRARRFGDRLGAVTGLPVRWVDEALTSVEAEARLGAGGGGRRARRRRAAGRTDAVAAQLLLQDALDRDRKREPS